MINLNEYDDVINNFRTWYNPTYKKIYSSEIKYRKYFTILQKYIPDSKDINYYIVLSDNMIPDRQCYDVYHHGNNAIKFQISAFLKELPLKNLSTITNVIVDLVEEDEHTSIYYLDI